jgi:hypothetical protein
MESLIALLVVLVAPMTIAFVLSTLLGRSLIVVLGLLGIGVVLSPSVFSWPT